MDDLESDFVSVSLPIVVQEEQETNEGTRQFNDQGKGESDSKQELANENESANDDNHNLNTTIAVQETCHGDIQQVESENVALSLQVSQVVDNPDVAEASSSVASVQEEVIAFEIDEDGDNLLHLAIIMRRMDVFRLIIETWGHADCTTFGIFLNMQNYLYQTSLHLAVLTNQAPVVEELISWGADILLQDQFGRTPLHIACGENLVDLIPVLLIGNRTDTHRGINAMTIRDFDGNTCLHVAALQGHIMAIDILVEHGADINIPDVKSSRTCLHFAVERGDVSLVAHLLSLGQINVQCETRSGDTPLVMARYRERADIVRLLTEFDSDVVPNDCLPNLDHSSSDEMG